MDDEVGVLLSLLAAGGGGLEPAGLVQRDQNLTGSNESTDTTVHFNVKTN